MCLAVLGAEFTSLRHNVYRRRKYLFEFQSTNALDAPFRTCRQLHKECTCKDSGNQLRSCYTKLSHGHDTPLGTDKVHVSW